MEQHKILESEKIYYQPHLLLPDKSEVATLRDDCSSLLSKLNNLRRGLFKRFDDVVKSIKEIIHRQDERDLEMARMQDRLNKLEMDLLQSTRSNSSVRTLHIIGRNKEVKPLYMWGK